MIRTWMAMGFATLLLCGCDLAMKPQGAGNGTEQAAGSMGEPGGGAVPGLDGVPAGAPHSNVGAAPDMERVLADRNVGAKGQTYGGGLVTEPIRVYWRAQDAIALEIQVKSAMNLYKALDDFGKGPKSHEEFMEKIVAANNIQLPELPPGARYIYDPATEELLVERPKAEARAE